MADFVAKFREPQGFSFKFGVGSAFSVLFDNAGADFKLKFSISGEKVEAEVYDGDYVVIPKVESQTMETAQKLMREDVVVRAIPFSKVPNTSGGNTISIG